MYYKIYKVLCLVILLTSTCILILPALAEQSIFNELSQNQLSELSVFYQNNSNATAFGTYNQSKELSIKYPFYSYDLALKCNEAFLQKNTTDLANAEGINATIENLTKIVISSLNQHQEEIFRLKQNSKSFASEEWLSLAERDLNDSNTFFDASQKSYSDGNYNATLIYLEKSNFALYKTGKLLRIAKNRNDSSVYGPKSNKEIEKIVSNWTKDANDKILFLAGSEERKDILKLANDASNDSQRYYSNGNYYLSLMSAAEAYALAEFGLDHEKYTHSAEALTKSEKQVEIANNSLTEIYKNYEVDMPLAELHLEMAKLRLADAKNTKEIYAIPLSDMAISEALIAEKQTNAVMDLKNAENQVNSSSVSMQTPFGIMPLLGIAVASYILRRK